MSFVKTIFAAVAAVSFALPAFSESKIMIMDAYARASGMSAMAGAAFMHIVNNGDEDDRLIAARSDVAKRVELHTHIEDDQGVMQMRKVEGGFPVAAGDMHALQRGGDHVMFMGLTRSLEQGAIVTVTLVFEKAGEITVDIPVDLERGAGMKMQHGNGQGMGNMNHDGCMHAEGEGMQEGQTMNHGDGQNCMAEDQNSESDS